VASFLGAVEGFHCTPRSKLPPALQTLAGQDGFVRLLPHVHDTDGFFAARFERCA
jgi:16S rRNA C967 or C1407 C5-methylase (RsmB/RsmF family)